ncbi:MAG: NUDIX hydrolase [Clostridia bacterium]|nr:NUDIX hydrolase [Clostridia bacterium]
MIIKEKTLERNILYKGNVLEYVVESVELENGMLAEREMVFHPGGVGVIALDDNGEAFMVRQYRKPYDKAILEIPAGKRDGGEVPEECARRELMEETGLEADELISLGKIYPSVGYTNETIYLFLARGLSQGKANPDEDEFVDVERIPFDELVTMVMSDEIKDAKSVVAILKTKFYMETNCK